MRYDRRAAKSPITRSGTTASIPVAPGERFVCEHLHVDVDTVGTVIIDLGGTDILLGTFPVGMTDLHFPEGLLVGDDGFDVAQAGTVVNTSTLSGYLANS